MLNYRPAKTADKPALQNLWEECFPDDKGTFCMWYFTNLFDVDTIYVAETTDEIVGSLYAPPIELGINDGSIIKVPYVQGIATTISHRNQSIAKNLINYSLTNLKTQGYSLAILEPFLPLFYEKLGWQTFAKATAFNLASFDIADSDSQDNNMPYYLDNNASWQSLNKIYTAFGSTFYSYPLRNKIRWQNLLYDHKADGGKLLANAEAYLLYFTKDSTLKIRELAYINKGAAQNILAEALQKLQLNHLEYIEQPQAMYYNLNQKKGTPLTAFPINNNYFNELF